MSVPDVRIAPDTVWINRREGGQIVKRPVVFISAAALVREGAAMREAKQ